MTNSRLTINCAGRLRLDVRTAGSEKCCQLPVPKANPHRTKATITINLAEVSTFCTLAVRPTPKQFTIVKAAISDEAASWAWPSRRENAPEPTARVAFERRLGKK